MSATRVDVLPHLKTARFDRALSYRLPDGMRVQTGDIVRVPLGPRTVFAYVVGEPKPAADDASLREIAERVDGPRAFDADGLALARWIADAYLCSLREALGAVVLAAAIPRTVDRFVPRGDPPEIARFKHVPERLVRLLWNDFRDGVGPDVLLRHPEARRAGDRATLLRALDALVRAGVLDRRRTVAQARVGTATVRILRTGAAPIRGKKAEALVAHVAASGELRRSDALLAGFSDAVIRRVVLAGALVEEQRDIRRERHARVALPPYQPTDEQREAIARLAGAIDARTFSQLLLHGVTGSGKTFVYLHAIARVLARGGRAIVLVPEIALTPQTAARFEAAFGDRVAVLHSALSDRERFDAWQAAARGEIDVVVGARSAVFAPLGDVRLIVVDEAHESSYRQDSTPRYDAVAVARERMRRANGVVVLGSATPALEDYARAKAGRFPLVRLVHRATAQPLPAVRVVDMGAEFGSGNRRVFSTALAEAIADRIARSEKTVLFINRRGSARFVLCRACGEVPECPRCSTSLTVHRSENLLRCHWCDFQRAIPEVCASCGAGPVREFGAGTQRVADEVERLFPDAVVVRMDSDTTTRVGDHARLLERFADEGDVLVGTQMVAKGLDFPQVTLVGAVAADLDLHVADFRAAERTFALLTQVCGRSGRARAGEAIVQTYAPEHPAIVYASKHDYDGFAAVELRERRALHWPPFTKLAMLGAIGRSRRAVETAIARWAAPLRGVDGFEVLGPAPYPVARVNDEWRYRIAVRTKALERLRAAIRADVLPLADAVEGVRLTVTIE
ncbi:primosomal protein N' [Vulcanimicrobium alpinum]|uniref:Replication restart protein PriA n=1 Tax=Vulcanimicrobium alpinum TaxID=3016050 RepID=A0AAN1XY15_UNVUL|nr:primosomal protein N' [Vulcanimicrobium alpinum]BDE06443.1 primosomal protein N' [Vulcanimicrobium alpinum]